MRQALAFALAKHADQPLTMDVARIILNDLFPVQYIDWAAFPQVHHAGYVLAVECFANAIDELHPLHLAHFQETEHWRGGIEMQADYDAAKERERAGKLLQMTVRKDGELVGHLRMYRFTSMHTMSDFLEEDCLFLRKDHRRGLLAMKLIDYVEQCARRLGVFELRASTKLENNVAILLRRKRWKVYAQQHVKVLTQEKAHGLVDETQ